MTDEDHVVPSADDPLGAGVPISNGSGGRGGAAAALRFSRLDPSDPRLQIINDEQRFSPIVLEYMKKHWGIADRGFDYNAVSVFGSQSTGKSTLLNRLFGTNFDVMNEATGRQQTTKGIWVSKAADANLLVMDVEGTDGGERFEDQDFERKSALFSLAISEVVIVNMYENNVGLFNGANLGLLKTVLDVNLQLFQQVGSPKTCLFFVIRDFTDTTPLSKLSATLMGYLHKIWSSLSKPAGKEDCSIDDFFDFSFVGLPHKVFARDAFESAVAKLRSKFVDSKNPEFVFKPNYHKHIPADGFPHFAESIWARIVSNRDLDLPTQTQLLAQHRCDEIAKEVFVSFSTETSHFKALLEDGSVLESFGKETNEIVRSSIAQYEKAASRYHREVFLAKRKEFFTRMAGALHVVYIQLLGNVHRRAIDIFTTSLSQRLSPSHSDESLAVGDFSTQLNEAVSAADSYFIKIAESGRLEGSDWSYDSQLAQLREEINKIAAEKRTESIAAMQKGLEKSASESLTEAIQLAVNEAQPGMWKAIIESLKEVLSASEVQLKKRALGFSMSEEELNAAARNLRWQVWTAFQDCVRKEISEDSTLARLRNRFEAKFRYDDKGVPRIWKLDDPIDTYFKNAFDHAEKLLNVFARIDVPTSLIGDAIIDDPRFQPTSTTILSAPRLQVIRDRFKKDADVLFIEAKRSMVVTTAKIPIWFVGLTVALGWNEFMMVLFNPLYFVLMLITLAGMYATWYLGMVGPLYQVAKATSGEIFKQVNGELQKRGVRFNEQGSSGRKGARSRSRTSVERNRGVGEPNGIELVDAARSLAASESKLKRKAFSSPSLDE